MQKTAGNTRSWQSLSAAVYRAFPWKRCGVAVALTLLAHGAIYEVAPETLTMLARTIVPAKPVELVRAEDLENIPQELLPEEFRNKPKFVPVTPDAPIATPKDQNFHSAANQRAAQENPDPESKDRIPTNDGEEVDSLALSDNVLPRELLPHESRESADSPQQQAKSPAETKQEATELEQGFDVPVEVGTLNKGEEAEKNAEEDSNDIPDPTPRPRIAPLPGLKTITLRSNTTVNEVGQCSLDAKYSEFGDYTQRMLEAIQAAWYIAANRMTIARTSSVVVVEFTLYSDGTIDDAKVIFSNAPAAAEYACLDAVQSRAPFEPWRADMVAIVGKKSEKTCITFHYR